VVTLPAMPSCQNTSGTRRRLRNISTPSMTNFLDPNIKCQFFFTEFHFLPDGVEHFTQKFGNMLRENELDLPVRIRLSSYPQFPFQYNCDWR
jgi:hypothetical protein